MAFEDLASVHVYVQKVKALGLHSINCGKQSILFDLYELKINWGHPSATNQTISNLSLSDKKILLHNTSLFKIKITEINFVKLIIKFLFIQRWGICITNGVIKWSYEMLFNFEYGSTIIMQQSLVEVLAIALITNQIAF